MRVPCSFQLPTETRDSHLELVCFSYTSQGPLKKWTDHYKLAITENSEATAPLREGRKEGVKVPRSFQLLTETRYLFLCNNLSRHVGMFVFLSRHPIWYYPT